MKWITLFWLLFTMISHHFMLASSKPKMVTSITPITSIVAMLVRDQVDVITIMTSSECPHHYHLKPSDVDKVKLADLSIYTDKQFDGFAAKLFNRYNKHIVQISDIKSVALLGNNWHIWLDLNNVKTILKELSVILTQTFPHIGESIKSNYTTAIRQLDNLQKLKDTKLAHLSDVILLDNSLEYLFSNTLIKVHRLYNNSNQKSTQYFNKLQKLLADSNSKCLILTPGMNDKIYQGFDANMVVVESENWPIPDAEIHADTFYNQYVKIIDTLAKC